MNGGYASNMSIVRRWMLTTIYKIEHSTSTGYISRVHYPATHTVPVLSNRRSHPNWYRHYGNLRSSCMSKDYVAQSVAYR